MKNHIDESALIKDSRFGENIRVYKNARITSSNIKDYVVIGDNSVVDNSILGMFNHINRNSMIIESQMGDYSYGGMQLVCMHSHIGRFSSISWNVSIGGANHDYSKVTTHSFLYNPNFGMLDQKIPLYDRFKNDCSIGNDVWIGAGASILRGVHVGDGAVVAAGAIVASDVMPYSIVAGVPAKMIKMRFDEHIIQKLLEIQWWDFPYDIIKKNIDLFNQNLNNEVLKKLQNIKTSIGNL